MKTCRREAKIFRPRPSFRHDLYAGRLRQTQKTFRTFLSFFGDLKSFPPTSEHTGASACLNNCRGATFLVLTWVLVCVGEKPTAQRCQRPRPEVGWEPHRRASVGLPRAAAQQVAGCHPLRRPRVAAAAAAGPIPSDDSEGTTMTTVGLTTAHRCSAASVAPLLTGRPPRLVAAPPRERPPRAAEAARPR